MISDGQRREIAANLRSESEAWLDTFPGAMIEEEAIGAAIMSDLVVFVGLDDSSPVHEIYARLADLIDRPTCKNSEYLYDGSFFECSKCGVRWELTCGSPADNNLNFCHRCGAEVVS